MLMTESVREQVWTTVFRRYFAGLEQEIPAVGNHGQPLCRDRVNSLEKHYAVFPCDNIHRVHEQFKVHNA